MIVKPLVAIIIILALCGGAYYYRDTIFAMYQAFMGPPGTQTARDAAPPAPATSRPKISDRIGPGGQDATQPRGGPGVAQRVVLYEEEPYLLPVSLEIGDKVLIEGTGAYTATYSSVAFNGFPPLKTYHI